MFKHSKDFGKYALVFIHKLIYCTRRGKIISNCHNKKIFPFIFKGFRHNISIKERGSAPKASYRRALGRPRDDIH